jgi:hypothetical protein
MEHVCALTNIHKNNTRDTQRLPFSFQSIEDEG